MSHSPGCKCGSCNQGKSSKTEAQYREHPKGQECCRRCNMFRPPSHCTTVAGSVSKYGWCKYFRGKDSPWME